MSHQIGIIAGDGIGAEVIAEALKVIDATGVKYDATSYDLGGVRYLSTGEVLSDAVLEELRGYDAILLGAVGTPDVPPGVLERGLLLRLRAELDLYVNLRPSRLRPGVTGAVTRLQPGDLHVHAVPVLGPGQGDTPPHRLTEPVALRDLPLHRDHTVGHTATVQRVRGEPRPQHDPVGQRVPGSDPEAEHPVGQRGFGRPGGTGQPDLSGGGGAENGGSRGQKSASVRRDCSGHG